MSGTTPFEHPDILPLILSYCSDVSLAQLMRTSRTVLLGIVSLRYPHILLDLEPTPHPPNPYRTDLPADAKWFSTPFILYIARYARMVSVKAHARYRCPPKGLLLGIVDTFNGQGTAEGAEGDVLSEPVFGKQEVGCASEVAPGTEGMDRGVSIGAATTTTTTLTAIPSHESSPCRAVAPSIDINALRFGLHGACYTRAPTAHTGSFPPSVLSGTATAVSRYVHELPDTGPCATMSLFRPRTVILQAFSLHGQLRVSASVVIYPCTTRVVVELDMMRRFGTDRASRSHSAAPDSVPLASVIPGSVEDVVLFLAPTALHMRRTDAPVYGTFLTMMADFVNASYQKLGQGTGQGERAYTFVNLGQLNPSWALKKVWDEGQLEHLILADISAACFRQACHIAGHASPSHPTPGENEYPQRAVHAASTGSGASDLPNTDKDDKTPRFRSLSWQLYLSLPSTRVESTPELLMERIQQAERQSSEIGMAARRLAQRQKEARLAAESKVAGA